jgi:hypothetical protein
VVGVVSYRPFIAFTALDGSWIDICFLVPQVLEDSSSDQAVWNCQVLGIFPPEVERSRDDISKNIEVSVCVPMLQV